MCLSQGHMCLFDHNQNGKWKTLNLGKFTFVVTLPWITKHFGLDALQEDYKQQENQTIDENFRYRHGALTV